MQAYFCESTGEPLQLCFDHFTLTVKGVEVSLEGIPLLKKPSTREYFLPSRTEEMVDRCAGDARSRGDKHLILASSLIRETRYPFAYRFAFKYSSIDYEFIPGLSRPHNVGYLTPVFFNLAVLDKYGRHPQYGLDLFSQTYGKIWQGDQWGIAFGINTNKKVIMWLGDVHGLPEEEIYFLRSENIESDHDVHSEFYDAQIETVFSSPSPLNELFDLRNEWNSVMSGEMGFPAYVLQGEVMSVIENLDRPVFWQDKHIGPAIESLNRVFVESINSKGFRSDLNQSCPGVDLKDLKTLKLVQVWLKERMGVKAAPDVMCPFFVLYDFRILTCHLLSVDERKKVLDDINRRLGLPPGNDDMEIIYDKTIDRAKESTIAILEAVKAYVARKVEE